MRTSLVTYLGDSPGFSVYGELSRIPTADGEQPVAAAHPWPTYRAGHARQPCTRHVMNWPAGMHLLTRALIDLRSRPVFDLLGGWHRRCAWRPASSRPPASSPSGGRRVGCGGATVGCPCRPDRYRGQQPVPPLRQPEAARAHHRQRRSLVRGPAPAERAALTTVRSSTQ
jgi:hypothetical protein